MSKTFSLILVVPRLLERLQTESDVQAAADESLLALVAGRGDVAHRWVASDAAHARLKPWQYGLLAALDLEPSSYPSAPIVALGEDFEGPHWIHAEPIHLAAGLNEVALVPLQPSSELTQAERDAMSEVIRTHIAADGFELRPSSRGWLIGSNDEFGVSTVPPAYAARHDWKAVLPSGAGAGQIRRLMTELQMLLHDQPVNAARATRGLPVVNAVWLWGSGVATRTPRTQTSVCVGSDAFLRGVCKANGWKLPADALSAAAVLESGGTAQSVTCVLDEVSPAAFERHWLEPFVAALKQGRIERLELVLDEWLVAIDRWRLRRFWRRPLPLHAWAAA